MLENFSVTILSGITVSLIFEILKGIFISIHNRICEKSLPFTVSGYWGTYHSSNDYSAFEFVVIKHQGVGLRVRLYQKTNDGRFHFYRGAGYIRGNKISLAYQEADKSKSNFTGTFNLLVSNASEHSLKLNGSYTEFSKNEEESTSHPYCLRELSLSLKEIILITAFRKHYIKKLMDGERFQDVCRKKV